MYYDNFSVLMINDMDENRSYHNYWSKFINNKGTCIKLTND